MAARRQQHNAVSVWLKETAEQRAGLNLRQIVLATMRLLDEGSLSVLSMRQLATELGVSPMSLYWYVATKEELLELALDEVFGEIPLAPAEDGWTEQVRAMATGLRQAFVAHPWAAQLIGRYLNIGPHALAVSDAALTAVKRSGLAPGQVGSAASLIVDYVCGFAVSEIRWREQSARVGKDEDELFHAMSQAVGARIADLGSVRELAERPPGSPHELRDRNFAFGLDCLLAGIQSLVSSSRESGGAAG